MLKKLIQVSAVFILGLIVSQMHVYITNVDKVFGKIKFKDSPAVTWHKIGKTVVINKTLKAFIDANVPTVKVPHINCKEIASGSIKYIRKAEGHQRTRWYKIKRKNNLEHNTKILPKNCVEFIKRRKYATQPLTQEEAEFPIAYNILMFKDVGQVERLLRAIYRPQNYYCIHIDYKSFKDVYKTMASIVSCFDNVFLASKSINVKWGYYSVLEPELVCMEDLWKFKKWKYLINLTGQEFPLQSNLAIVKIIKGLNGANIVDATVNKRNWERTAFVFPGYTKKKDPPPVNVTLTKGSIHIVVKRAFVDYVLHNKTALMFREWVKDTGHPDETLFSSLNHSPQLNVPGAYKGEPEADPVIYPFLARVKNWYEYNIECHGKFKRAICIFALGDLKYLVNRKELFANKFHDDYSPITYDCMEEIHYNNTRNELLGITPIDVSYYEQLNMVKPHMHV